ncbi:hypothetical protein [Cupriavidus pinatubonensis]|uniref:hypothetical protein n=1 Tax=Cupriavidus pinatubonensis TaxID=248026 RepID=UPI00280BC74C|nr:hypothetical protein [Cupriavidus pinatubonensis]
MSPATASVKLESALRTQLFERTSRKLRLTNEGRIYLAIASTHLRRLKTRLPRFMQAPTG